MHLKSSMEIALRYLTDIINIFISVYVEFETLIYLILCSIHDAIINEAIQKLDLILHLKPGLMQIRTINCNYCNVSTEHAAFF